MNLESLSSSLLFIGPCIIVLYFTFSDRLKAPTLLTVASGIAIFVLIDIALTYIYMTTPLTAFTMALLAISGVMAGVIYLLTLFLLTVLPNAYLPLRL